MASRLIVLSCILAFASADESISNSTASDVLKINRVIGGKNAMKGEFPHQVSLQWGMPPAAPFSHMCGGSIINENWVLTAAHCVTELPSFGEYVAKAGKTRVNEHETTEQTSTVAKIITHHSYRGGVSPFDIALLKLATPFKLNEFVRAIPLPEANVIPHGIATLSGWGSTSKTIVPSLPNVLQKAKLPILSIEECRAAMRSQNSIHDTNVCTGPLTGGISACNGDSGGPLIAKNPEGVNEIIGIVSWGVTPCAQFGTAAVFTRVSAFVDWINNAIHDSEK